MLKFLQKLFFIVIVFIGFAAQCQGESTDPISAIKSGDSIDRTLVVPETNGVTIHNVVESGNFQKIANYFTPYLEVLALNFAVTLVHEIGHNIVYVAGTKEWSKIWIGEHGAAQFSFDQDPRLDIEKWNSYLKGRDPVLEVPGNNQGKWILHLVNDDKLFNNDWISIYKPNANLGFAGNMRSRSISSKYLEATLSLMGPAFGALFSWFMLQNVHQPHLEFTAKQQLFILPILNLFPRGADGENALKALNVQTDWMKAVEQELPHAESAFNLVNFEQVVDVAMFSKAFQAKNEQQRMIALMGQSAFKVMVPVMIHYIREHINNLIHDTDVFVKDIEDQAYYLNYRKSSSVLNFLRNFVVITLPVLLMYEIIEFDVRKPISQRIAQYF